MKEPVKNVAASVLARLKNQAEVQGRPFAEILQYYAMERFLFRLSKTKYAEKFILKGGLLFYAWDIPLRRPTKDIDFRGYISNNREKSFEGVMVQTAIESTFGKRDTEIPIERPLSLSAGFAHTSRARWINFLKKTGTENNQVADFADVIEKIWKFIGRPLQASHSQIISVSKWVPKQGWV